MNKEREIDGIRIVLNGEQYEEYKGTLQDQINELQDRIDKAIEYIENDLIPYGNEYHWDNASLEDEVKELLDILRGNNE
jgi:hypothetical protein